MKIISQDGFDEVVLENINDFDNTLEEAIENSVKEFEAQGVVFGNIVKNPRLNDEKTKLIHEVLECLSVIQNRDEPSPDVGYHDLSQALKKFTCQCKLTLAHRVLATKHKGYEIILTLIKELKNNGNDEYLALALQSMVALTDTNPDILTDEGVELLLGLLQIWGTRLDNEQVAFQLANWSLECCLKHEENRQTLVLDGAPALLKNLLVTNRNSRIVTRAACKALKSFVLDDDIRTPFGKAHSHARLLVEEQKMIKTCLEIVKGFLDDAVVTSEILSTLSRLCVRAEYCQEAVDNNVLIIINDVLVSFPDNAQLNRQSINLIKTISGNDDVKEKCIKIGVAQLIVAALVKHQSCAATCESAGAAISMLALRVPAHAKQLIQLGAADAVVQAMKIHKDSKQVQKIGCMAIRNLSCRIPEHWVAFVECQVEDVIQTALKNFPDDIYLKDIANAALRDLNLDVKLEERWKGTRGEIER